MIVKGRNRDTAWYSMTDNEWPVQEHGWRSGSIRRNGTKTVVPAVPLIEIGVGQQPLDH